MRTTDVQIRDKLTQTLPTDRLILRPLKLADAGRIAELACEWDIARMTARMPYPYTLVDADAWIGSIGQTEFVRGIEHQGTLVGACGYTPGGDGSAEFGYWIGKPYWGRGFATEAGRALIGHCFRDADLRRLTCCHFTDNPASARVIRKLGFRAIGPGVGWSDARQAEAPTVRYVQRRSWSQYLMRRAA